MLLKVNFAFFLIICIASCGGIIDQLKYTRTVIVKLFVTKKINLIKYETTTKTETNYVTSTSIYTQIVTKTVGVENGETQTNYYGVENTDHKSSGGSGSEDSKVEITKDKKEERESDNQKVSSTKAYSNTDHITSVHDSFYTLSLYAILDEIKITDVPESSTENVQQKGTGETDNTKSDLNNNHSDTKVSMEVNTTESDSDNTDTDKADIDKTNADKTDPDEIDTDKKDVEEKDVEEKETSNTESKDLESKKENDISHNSEESSEVENGSDSLINNEDQDQHQTLNSGDDSENHQVTNNDESQNSSSENSETIEENNTSSADAALESEITKVANTFEGIAYTPFTHFGYCETDELIKKQINDLEHFSIVRLYGVDCGQIGKALKYKKPGQRLFIGLLRMSTISEDIQELANQVLENGSWDDVHTVYIGNELVNDHIETVDKMKEYIDFARNILTIRGYSGPIVTVETFIAVLENPSLCEISDYIAVNTHPFFDKNLLPENAGEWTRQQIDKIIALCHKNVLITETGWPTGGESNGLSVPSKDNQLIALESIRKAMGSNLILFSAFDELWKQDGPYNVEKFWGIL